MGGLCYAGNGFYRCFAGSAHRNFTEENGLAEDNPPVDPLYQVGNFKIDTGAIAKRHWLHIQNSIFLWRVPVSGLLVKMVPSPHHAPKYKWRATHSEISWWSVCGRGEAG